MQTIKIQTCLLLPEQLGDEIPYTPEVSTVRGLLRYLSGRIEFQLLEGEDSVIRELDVSVNGKDLSFCPSGLATRLRPNDSVAIHFIPMGGG